jgi:alcohol dehydrogenase
MVLGHEAAGEVLSIGSGVESFSAGDRVVLAFMPSCGECESCRSGRAALCEPGAAANAAGTLLSGDRRWTGPSGDHPHHHLGVSAFSEQVVVSEKSAVLIPDDMPFDVAAVFGCAALTGVGAALNAAEVQPGESVAIFGLGGVGLSALLGAKLAGAAQIIAVDPVPSKRSLALELGATVALDGGGDTVSSIVEASDGGVHKAIETAGSARVLEAAYSATRRGGTTVTVGLPHPDDELRIKAVSLVAEEKTLRGSYLGSGNPAVMLPQLFAHWQAGNLPVERLITHRLTRDEINDGFDRLASGEAVRQIITP